MTSAATVKEHRQKPKMTSQWVRVMPEDALAMLNAMAPNRKLVQSHVDKLAAAMRAGEWVEDAGDPIRFNEEGELIDGQHRLWAVVESGVTLQFHVIKGLPGSVMDVLDTGRSRSLADFLAIHGMPNARELAAALSYLNVFRATGEVSVEARPERRLNVRSALRLLEANPGLIEGVRRGAAFHKRVGGGSSIWGVTFHILSAISFDDAAAFFDLVASGTGLSEESPVLHLRNRLLANRISMHKLPTREYSALIFKAWNNWRDGVKVRQFQWRGGGAHPEEYPIPH
mgnify:CR=1 FL=1